MENVSENRRRGRPLTIHGQMRVWARREFPGVGDRQRGNILWSFTARALLGNGDDPQFDYLVGKGNSRSRTSILAELGRFEDQETIRKLAAEICRAKLKTADAIRWLRSVRGVARPPSSNALAGRIGKCIDDHLHSGATFDDALAALELITRTVERLKADAAQKCVIQ